MHQVDLRWRVLQHYAMEEAKSLMKPCEYNRGYTYQMLYDFTYVQSQEDPPSRGIPVRDRTGRHTDYSRSDGCHDEDVMWM